MQILDGGTLESGDSQRESAVVMLDKLGFGFPFVIYEKINANKKESHMKVEFYIEIKIKINFKFVWRPKLRKIIALLIVEQ